MKTVLQLSFRGSAYSGWQVQPNAVSVQKTVQDAVEAVLEHDVKLTGCSRTDAGVHANAYICHLDCEAHIPCDRLPYAISRLLPDDISVDRAWLADDDFHSRYSAKGKEYMYLIWNSRLKNVFYTDTALKWVHHIDIDAFNAVGSDFVGTHDFAAVRSVGTDVKSTVRTVYYYKIEREGDLISLRVCANGFLYNMARAMAGTCVYAAEGKFPPESVAEILERGDRKAAGPTVPPGGLYMTQLWYDDGKAVFHVG